MQTTLEDKLLDIIAIRKEFPILSQKIRGKDLVYLDNAATSQKPKVVLDALMNYYTTTNANIHRGIHTLAEQATALFEETRASVRSFINAKSKDEVIFVRGVTEAVNLVAQTYGRQNLKEGDEVIISTMEHHSNIVPWQMICEATGAVLKIIPITDAGEIEMESYENLLSAKTKIVSVVHVSNSMGTVNPVKEILDKAHSYGAVVFIDGAQAVSHLEIDVQDLNCDFYAFSGHKMYAPTGIGVLYGKREILEAIPPYHGGGEMIKEVSFAKTTYNDLPFKFEAGTPNIADTIALKAAIDFINGIGKPAIAAHENELLEVATKKLLTIDGLKIIGTANKKIGVISCVLEGVHHQDLAILLDNEGIAVRTGHHCTQPLMNRFGITGTTRASFAVYNTLEEIESLNQGLIKACKMLR